MEGLFDGEATVFLRHTGSFDQINTDRNGEVRSGWWVFEGGKIRRLGAVCSLRKGKVGEGGRAFWQGGKGN